MERKEPTLHDLHVAVEVVQERIGTVSKQVENVASKLDSYRDAQMEEKAKNARTAGIVAVVVTVLGFLLQAILKTHE